MSRIRLVRSRLGSQSSKLSFLGQYSKQFGAAVLLATIVFSGAHIRAANGSQGPAPGTAGPNTFAVHDPFSGNVVIKNVQIIPLPGGQHALFLNNGSPETSYSGVIAPDDNTLSQTGFICNADGDCFRVTWEDSNKDGKPSAGDDFDADFPSGTVSGVLNKARP